MGGDASRRPGRDLYASAHVPQFAAVSKPSARSVSRWPLSGGTLIRGRSTHGESQRGGDQARSAPRHRRRRPDRAWTLGQRDSRRPSRSSAQHQRPVAGFCVDQPWPAAWPSSHRTARRRSATTSSRSVVVSDLTTRRCRTGAERCTLETHHRGEAVVGEAHPFVDRTTCRRGIEHGRTAVTGQHAAEVLGDRGGDATALMTRAVVATRPIHPNPPSV